VFSTETKNVLNNSYGFNVILDLHRKYSHIHMHICTKTYPVTQKSKLKKLKILRKDKTHVSQVVRVKLCSQTDSSGIALPSKCDALSSNPSTTKKKKKSQIMKLCCEDFKMVATGRKQKVSLL
jgi:hypothetical protein